MQRILIVEDEDALRVGMVRALSKLPDVTVVAAGNVRDALIEIDRAAPDAVISDLDLPDRLGAELLGELERRGIRAPVTFVSAYTRELGAHIPRSSRVQVLDKPVSLEQLREIAVAALATRESELPPPFGPADYLQLACLGRLSVLITRRESHAAEPSSGRIVVWRGELWSARDDEGEGPAAFQRLVTRPGTFRCHTLDRDPGPRQIEGQWEMMLLDAIRIDDERRLAELVAEEAAAEALANAPPSYEASFARGVEAFLARDLAEAGAAFAAALAARPGDPKATANLERLRTLGHIPAASPDSRDDGGGS